MCLTKSSQTDPLGDYLAHIEPLTVDRDEMRNKHDRARRGAADTTNVLRFSFESHNRFVMGVTFEAHERLANEIDSCCRRTFHIVATSDHERIFSPSFNVHVHGKDGGFKQTYFDKKMFYRGHVEGELQSKVLMYVNSGEIEATIYLNNDTFYVERAAPHFGAGVDFTHIVYRQTDLIYNFTSLCLRFYSSDLTNVSVHRKS